MTRRNDPEPPADATTGGTTPGISVRQTRPHAADVTVDGDASLVQLHTRLLDAGLADAVDDALRRLDGETPGDWRAVLTERGVSALDGHLADVLASAAADLRALDLDPDRDDAGDDLAHAHGLLAELGDGTAGALPSDLGDLGDALPPLLAGSSTTPHVSVRLGVAWTSRRPEQREATLRWLARLALGARVDLVVAESAAHRIVDKHRDAVPAHVLTSLRNRGRGHDPAHAAAERAERVDDATAALDRDGRPLGVLAALARSHDHTLTYSRLASTLALDSAPYEAVRTLDADHGLVERTERADGETVVSLRPAGVDVLNRLSSSAAVSGPDAVGPRTDGGPVGPVSDNPQNPPAMPYYPREDGDAPPDGPTASGPETAGDRPAGEPDAVSSADGRLDGWQSGLVEPRFATRTRWLPAVDAVDAGEVALVDVDLDLDASRDGRAPVVSYSAERDAVYAGAEYHNPMQAALTLAHGLTSEQLWTAADLDGRIGDGLRGLDVTDHRVLHKAARIGWLPTDVTDGDEVRDSLRDARDALLHDSGLTADDDSDVTRAGVAARAVGLVGVVVRLLDLADVELTLDYRLADVTRHFGSEGNGGRRDDLLDHLRQLTIVCSRSGAWSAYCQLVESRETVREDAWTMDATPGVDVATPSCGLLVHGAGAETLGDDLAGVLDETVVHDDAPDLRLDIDVREGTDRHRLASTARGMLRDRGLRPTPTATAVLVGMVADPWMLAGGIQRGLERESPRREIHLDEVRRILAECDASRLLPDASPAARAGVAALASADEALSQAELCRRAGISTQSWRNHRDGLVAADWVRETAGGWRLALPFRAERWDDVDVAEPPWWLRVDGAGLDRPGRADRRPGDVVASIVLDAADAGAVSLADDYPQLLDALTAGPVPDDVAREVARDLDLPWRLIVAGAELAHSPPDPSTVSIASRTLTRQSSLTETVSDTPQNPPIDG